MTNCINSDSIIDSIITYEDNNVDETFCLNSNDINIFLPINPYSNHIYDLNFYTKLKDVTQKNMNIKLDSYNETKNNLENNHIDIEPNKKYIISVETVNFLKYYTTGTYMIHHKYFRIKPEIQLELSYFRQRALYEVYRGIHFGLRNIEYLRNLVDGLTVSNIILNNSIKPISCSMNKDVSREFSEKGLYGIVGVIETEYYNVLVDTTILDKDSEYTNRINTNGFKCDTCGEEEVVLIPGKYEFIVEDEDYEKEKTNAKYMLNIMEKIYNKLKPYIVKDDDVRHFKILSSTIEEKSEVLIVKRFIKDNISLFIIFINLKLKTIKIINRDNDKHNIKYKIDGTTYENDHKFMFDNIDEFINFFTEETINTLFGGNLEIQVIKFHETVGEYYKLRTTQLIVRYDTNYCNINEKYNLINELYDGKQELFYKNGNKYSDINYSNGYRNGITTEWFISGEIKEISNFQYDTCINKTIYNIDGTVKSEYKNED